MPPFKKTVEAAATKHMQDNLKAYVNGMFSSSESPVLITTWLVKPGKIYHKVERCQSGHSLSVASPLLPMDQRTLTSISKGLDEDHFADISETEDNSDDENEWTNHF